MRGGPTAGKSGTLVEIAGANRDGAEHMRQVLQLAYDYMDHGIFAFDMPVSEPSRAAPRHLVKAFPGRLVQQQVDGPRFVFQRDECDALGGTWPLPQQDQARHAHTTPVLQVFQLDRRDHVQTLELLAMECQRMAAQRQTGCLIVGKNLLLARQRRQLRGWIVRRCEVLEQRQLFDLLVLGQRFPQGAAPVTAERQKDVGGGEPHDDRAAQTGAACEFGQATKRTTLGPHALDLQRGRLPNTVDQPEPQP